MTAAAAQRAGGGHGLAMRVLRAAGVREAGSTLNLSHVTAASDSAVDLVALVRAETMQTLMWNEPLLRALSIRRRGDVG